MNSEYKEVKFGTVEEILNKLGGINGVVRFLADELVVTERSPTCRLKFHATYECPGIKRFVAKDNLKLGTNNGVRIGYLSDNVKKGSGLARRD